LAIELYQEFFGEEILQLQQKLIMLVLSSHPPQLLLIVSLALSLFSLRQLINFSRNLSRLLEGEEGETKMKDQ
jgi:hypothetical protein